MLNFLLWTSYGFCDSWNRVVFINPWNTFLTYYTLFLFVFNFFLRLFGLSHIKYYTLFRRFKKIIMLPSALHTLSFFVVYVVLYFLLYLLLLVFFVFLLLLLLIFPFFKVFCLFFVLFSVYHTLYFGYHLCFTEHDIWRSQSLLNYTDSLSNIEKHTYTSILIIIITFVTHSSSNTVHYWIIPIKLNWESTIVEYCETGTGFFWITCNK